MPPNAPWFTLVARIEEVLKGEASSDSVPVRYSPSWYWWNPTPDDVVRAQGGQFILFLVDEDDGYYYFEGSTRGTLLTYADSIAGPLRAEISQQQAILARSRTGSARADPHDEEVRRLIADLGRRGRAQRAFERLLGLGCEALPALVRRMDDRRAFPLMGVEVHNTSPHAFESVLHYGPDLVLDALSIVLNRITGESFNGTYNGGSDRERRRTVDVWRIYLAYWEGEGVKCRR